nr:hypothetical protein [Tanacetum cinerariifolium]
MSALEKLMIFVYTLALGVFNRDVGEHFQRSGKTISRAFHDVLDAITAKGSAYDTRVFLHTINRQAMNFPKPPKGKYYLVDKGYPKRNGYLVPYSKTRYHRSRFQNEPPTNMKEAFNRSHSSLRSYNERKNTSIVESEIQTNATMAYNRTMAQMLQAPIEGYEDAIVDALDSAAGGNFLDKIPREYKLDIRMNRFEKSLNEMKNSLVTPTAPLKAVTEVYVTCGSNHSYNQCPLTRGGNGFLVFRNNIQQFQTAAVGNFIQNRQNVSTPMRPPGFHQSTQQNNNQNHFQGNNLNQNRQPNQGAIYQNGPPQNPNFQAPPQQNTVTQGKFEAYTT